MRWLMPLIALSVTMTCSGSWAKPSWKAVTAYEAPNNAIAGVFIDEGSIVKSGRLIRVWTMTDYTEFQEGDWVAAQGVSRAYMSERRLLVINCRTRDLGYGSWAALDGRKGTGSIVHSDDAPVPTAATFPTAPGTVGNQIAEAACRRAR